MTGVRWRAAADLVTAILGVALWLSLVVVPGYYTGALGRGVLLGAAAVPLLPLAAGVVRRSPLALLFAFPLSLLVPVMLDERLKAGSLHDPTAFSLAAASLLAYLLGASFLSAFREPAPPERLRSLGDAATPIPPRWRRRFRLYAALAGYSVVFPAVLLFGANFARTNQAYLRELYPGRAASMAVLLNLGVLVLWAGLFYAYFFGLLRAHRSGDRELVAELERLAQGGRRGPRPTFYLAVACALALMGLLLVLRYR